MASDGRFAAFDRLSSREKLMVGGLGSFFLVGIVLVAVVLVSSFLSGIEEEIALAEEKAQKIEVAAANYLDIKGKQEATVALMEDNPIISLRIPINNIAKQVSLADGQLLSDVIRFEGKTVETPIAAFGEKKAKAKKRTKKDREEVDEGPQNLKVEQDFEFRDVPIDSLYDFLEKIEQSPELLFVTKLEIRRKFGEYDVAQNAFVTVTTFKRTGGS